MRNIKLVIEYDGTNYQGWQVQPNGPTVQEKIEEAILAITGERLRITGSGRTDAGVHALGQVANFRTASGIPASQMVFALNSELPPDIAVKKAEDVPLEFHARYDAVAKAYQYLIWNSKVRPALNRNRHAWVRPSLNFGWMRSAALSLEGEHDFRSFTSEAGGKDCVRTIHSLELNRKEELISMDIRADGFLYNMVRAIAGTLIDVGRGYTKVKDVKRMLEAKDRTAGGPTAPACGLYLVRVEYG